MKKKYYLFITIVMMMIALIACGNNQPKDSGEIINRKTITEKPDTQKNDNKDKTVNEKTEDVSQQDNKEFDSEPFNPNKQENRDNSSLDNSNWVKIIGLVVGLLLILLIIIKYKNIKEDIDVICELLANNKEKTKINSKRIADIENKLHQKTISNNKNTTLSEIENRLKVLEKQFASFNCNSEISYTNNISTQKSQKRTIYATINNGIYFLNIVESNQEACVYKIDTDNETTGKFTIISLEKIKSRNGWDEVVETDPSSNCELKEANTFQVIKYGECVKTPQGYWKKTKSLIIKLTK